MISLIGAVASGALALIFPALLEIMTYWFDRREHKFLGVLPWIVWFVKDALIILLGVVGLILGTYASISNIVDYIRNQSSTNETCHTLAPH